jgi:hypothetical protein
MKEVLIYGALVAAVLGVSTTLIQNMDGQFRNASNTIQTGINTSITDLTNVVTGGGSGGQGGAN